MVPIDFYFKHVSERFYLFTNLLVVLEYRDSINFHTWNNTFVGKSTPELNVRAEISISEAYCTYIRGQE